jgi:phenylacetate-CoA oxygenase PaaI subunit
MSTDAAQPSAPALDPASAWGRFVLAWGDDEVLLAHQLGTLLTGQSEVEEVIAVGSLCQDELAHGMSLWDLVETETRRRDALFYARPISEFLNCSLVAAPAPDWGAVVVRQYIYELADAVRVEQVLSMSGVPEAVVDVAQGMASEERLHRAHWGHWCQVLTRTPTGRERLRIAAESVWRDADDVLELPPGAEGLDWPVAELREAYTRQVTTLLQPLQGAQAAHVAVASRPRTERQSPELVAALERSRSVYAEDPDATWG